LRCARRAARPGRAPPQLEAALQAVWPRPAMRDAAIQSELVGIADGIAQTEFVGTVVGIAQTEHVGMADGMVIAQTVNSEIAEDASLIPPQRVPRQRGTAVLRKKGLSRTGRRASAPFCVEYDADWSTLNAPASLFAVTPSVVEEDVVAALPVSFRMRLDEVLAQVVPAEWDYDFHFDVPIRSGMLCPGQVSDCLQDSRMLQCTRCQLCVCVQCSFSHALDHLSEFERIALQDDAMIRTTLSRIHHACTALV